MNDYLTSNIKKEVDRIKIPEDKLDERIGYAIKRGKKNQRRLGNKVFYMSGAAVLLFALLVSSLFVSPTMAKVVSKIPYLGQIFESKNDIVSHISEELIARGYKISGVGVSFPEKELLIGINGSDEYFENVKDDVEYIAREILQSRKYDAYTQKVMLYKESKDEVDEKEEMKRKEFDLEYERIHNVVTKELKRRDYDVLSLSMSDSPKTIQIEIPDTETRIVELKKEVNHILNENKIDAIPLNVKKIDMKKREQDKKWIEILNIVGEDLLGKKEYKVTTVGYSIEPEPEIQAFITLPSSDENAKVFAKQIEKVIGDFLKSEQMKSKIGNDTYHITIYSQDNKIIN
ncbi:hypothetical protein CU633_05890 [Bacillus sp. V3-13]|uniref:DUF4030 domain-containing protein n=1 Tax=Bacillus sp. V3-13 TaxID=2053728 RepID=UPI000C78F73B|nr:DUF4030 domain-containing protein [Bacillus sp. V3-13]PLR78339.1 hypothetical protein CU633_05890 [Bacillus sp. V3-13]